MPGRAHGVAERAAAGADQHAIARQAGVEDGLQKRDALLERERVGLARGTEYHQTVAALVQQPAGVGDEARRVWLQILIDGRQHGAPHARDAGSCRALRRCRRASFLELGRHGAPPAAQRRCVVTCPQRRGKAAIQSEHLRREMGRQLPASTGGMLKPARRAHACLAL